MRTVLALLLVTAIASETASACPASNDPDYHCSKYDFMYKELQPVKVSVLVYVRDARGAIPRRAKNVMKYLTSSGWHARDDQGVADTLQLFDGANVPDTYEAVEGARQLFINSLDKVDHQFHVSLDEGTFRVMRCKEAGHTRTCLVRE